MGPPHAGLLFAEAIPLCSRPRGLPRRPDQELWGKGSPEGWPPMRCTGTQPRETLRSSKSLSTWDVGSVGSGLPCLPREGGAVSTAGVIC
jgi:hypothetical protein